MNGFWKKNKPSELEIYLSQVISTTRPDTWITCREENFYPKVGWKMKEAYYWYLIEREDHYVGLQCFERQGHERRMVHPEFSAPTSLGYWGADYSTPQSREIEVPVFAHSYWAGILNKEEIDEYVAQRRAPEMAFERARRPGGVIGEKAHELYAEVSSMVGSR
jgi:hypothetical protein